LLVGEPGIGKSRTAERLATVAESRGAEVLVGRCYEGEGAPALWPWVQVIGAYAAARDPHTLLAQLDGGASDVAAVCPAVRMRLPDLPPPPQLEADQARFRFFAGVSAALRRAAAERPVVIVLDDLHGADTASLLLLQFLARDLRAARVLVVGALRDVALRPEHPLAAVLGELVREQVSERVLLGGLTEAEVGDLIAEAAGEVPPPGLAAAVHARTEGNPLYVTEVVRALCTRGRLAAAAPRDGWKLDVPDTVRLTIGRHLLTVSPACREVLALAAVIGRQFGLAPLVRASGLEPARVVGLLDEAREARIVDPTELEPGGWRFAHALYAEALVDGLTAAMRVALHRRDADALASEAATEERAAEIAHHHFRAGPAGAPTSAVDWASRAAKRALERFAYDEAAHLYGMALTAVDWMPQPDERRRAEVLLGLGEAYKRAGDERSAKTFMRVAELGHRLASPELLTWAALGFAPTVVYAERPEPDPMVVRLLEDAIAAWAERDSALHACALARLGVTFVFGEHVARIGPLFDHALAMARRVADPAAIRYVLGAQMSIGWMPEDVGERLALSAELVRMAEESCDLQLLARGRLARCMHLMQAGDVRQFDRELGAFARLANELRQPVWSWYVELLQTVRAILDGRFTDGERGAHAALAIGREVMPYAAPGYFAGVMLVLRSFQGRTDEVAQPWRDLIAGHPDKAAASSVAWIEAQLGNREEARRLFDSIAPEHYAAGTWNIRLVTHVFLAETCAFVGDAQRAQELYAWLCTYDGQWTLWAEGVSLGPIAFQLGLLARTMGRLDDAVRHFADALASLTRAGARPYLARVQYEYALTLRARGASGDAERAEALLAEAVGTAIHLGMARLVLQIGVGPDLTAATPGNGALTTHLFRREGEFWTIAYDGRIIRLRDMRGLRYLAQLLHHAGQEFHATQLVAGTNGGGNGVTSAAALDGGLSVHTNLGGHTNPLDPQARAAYRDRLADLDADLADAERHNDLGRLAHARAERDALVAQLAAAARSPRLSADAERARLTVTKGIKLALAKISAGHPELGRHLAATVKRGYFCGYFPDPRHPIDWR
jgi:tetratricopeptide (TPR) repeat protein